MLCDFAGDDQVLIYSMPRVCMSKRQRIKRIERRKSWSRSQMLDSFNRICTIYRKNYRNTGRWLMLRLLRTPSDRLTANFVPIMSSQKYKNRKEQYIRMARHRHSVVGNLWCEQAHVDLVMLTSSSLSIVIMYYTIPLPKPQTAEDSQSHEQFAQL